MKLKYFLAFVLLFETYSAIKNNECEERKTLMTMYQDKPQYSQKKNESSSNRWEKGVRDTYAGCAEVLDGYPGPTFQIGVTLITSFKTYTDKLASLTKCNATIISSRSIAVLEAISLFSKLGKSPSYLLLQFGKALPKVSSLFREIVTNLSPSIGEFITHTITELITELENSMMEKLKQYQNRFVERTLERCEKIDFESEMKNVRVLINTIALIAETVLNDCDCVTVTNDAYEAIAVLAFILQLYLITVQGSNSSIGTVLHSESEHIPDFLRSCFSSMDPLIGGMAHSISLITNDVTRCVREFLTSFVGLTHSLNEALDDLLGPFEGSRITVGQIKKNLART